MTDSQQLLAEYRQSGSDTAFRELVTRYVDLVYSTALRLVEGDTHRAEDVAQTVFVDLARKARTLPTEVRLGGWLHRDACLVAGHTMRGERRRQSRERQAVEMNVLQNHSEADFSQVAPLLDQAINELGESDRTAILLRFFEQQDFHAVGQALGSSEDAARMRVTRALDKLHTLLTHRGVTLSAAALGTALATEAVTAAPAGLAGSVAGAALASAAAGGGILTLVTSAKGTSLMALLTGLVVLAAAFTISKSTPHRPQVAQPLQTSLTTSLGTPDTNSSLTGPVTPSKSAGDAGTNNTLAAALDKVKAALRDPNATTLYPNSVMQNAIAGLGGKKKAALPILEAALNDANAEVRLRAVDGLGIIGPEAKEAAPLLLGVLRDGGVGQAIPQTRYTIVGKFGAVRSFPIYTDNIILYALGQLHPSPGILPEFARMVKENQSVRHTVYRATHQFPGVRQSMRAGGWLWAIANEDSQALNNAFLPLLQDPDWRVRSVAALSLVSALGDQADAGVFSVAAELLRSGEGEIVRIDGMSLLVWAATDPRSDGPPGEPSLTAARLGPYWNGIVSALADAADHTTREDLRLKAAKMLDTLVPEFRKVNPSEAELELQKQSDAFTSKVWSGGATVPEVLEGLKKFPKTAPGIASYYARSMGSNAVELLPAFGEALSVLAPLPEANKWDRTKAANARQHLTDSMQKIAPELPKPIFTFMDTTAITRIMNDPAVQADPNRFQKVSDACKLAEWPDRRSIGLFDVSPDKIRRLLAAMKNADAPTYDALVAKVKEIDQHFSDTAVGSGKGN